jgi:hypothetical protein
VYVTPGNPPDAESAMTFRTKGGSVVAACDAGFGPRVISETAEPDFYPTDLPLIVETLVFFIRPADATNPAITYRLTITCSGGAPRVTVTSYQGDKKVTPSPAPPATTPTTSPSA